MLLPVPGCPITMLMEFDGKPPPRISSASVFPVLTRSWQFTGFDSPPARERAPSIPRVRQCQHRDEAFPGRPVPEVPEALGVKEACVVVVLHDGNEPPVERRPGDGRRVG